QHPDAGDVTGGRGIVGLSRLLPRMAAVSWPPLSGQHNHCDHRNGYEDNHPAVPDQCAHTHPELSRPAVECVTRLLTPVDVEDLRALGGRAIDIESVRALRWLQALRFCLRDLLVECTLARERVPHCTVALVAPVFVPLVVRLRREHHSIRERRSESHGIVDRGAVLDHPRVDAAVTLRDLELV